MMNGFQTVADARGNLWMVDGWVAQLRSGVRLQVGAGGTIPLLDPPFFTRSVLQTPAALGGTFLGGSGRNLVTTGLTPSISGPPIPVGIWVPQRPDVWTLGIFTLTKTGASAANISDGTNTVASLTTGSAPVGNYVATSYGQTTYNGGVAFTISAAAEEGAPGTLPGYVCTVSAGTAQAGNYTLSSAIAAASATDANWTVLVNSDGTADLIHSGTIMASRAAGPAFEMSGVYEANSAGMAAYNSGLPWQAILQTIPAVVRAGFAYVTITETAGVLSSVSGPFFATALPADSGTVCHVPVAQSDGLGGLRQLHAGLLIWTGLGPSSIGAAAAADINSSTYLKLMECYGIRFTGDAAATYIFSTATNSMVVSGGSGSYPVVVFCYNAADFPTVNGRTTKMRVKGEIHTNAVAPTSSFSFGLYEITRPTSGGGAAKLIVFNVGSEVTGSDTGYIVTPAAKTSSMIVGTDFDVSNLTNGHFYGICLVTTQTLPTSAMIAARAELQMRNY